MKHIFQVNKVLPLLLALFFTTTLHAQDNKVGQMLTSQQFVFKAETAIPSGVPSRNLSSGYDLQVNGANVQAYLPYFGTSNVAPINPAENPLQFTSLQFEYNITNRKDRWEVDIKLNDVTEVRDMQLTVFSNGRATLQVNSNRRSPISFSGYIDSYGTK